MLYYLKEDIKHLFTNLFIYLEQPYMLIVVGIETGYGLNDWGVGVWVPVESRIFSSPRRPDGFWVPPSLLSKRYRGSFPGDKQQRRKADHSPPANLQVKKTWIYTPTSPLAFMA
jgi:hypothetical protein